MGANKTTRFIDDEIKRQSLSEFAHNHWANQREELGLEPSRTVPKTIVIILKLSCLSGSSACNPELAHISHSHPLLFMS